MKAFLIALGLLLLPFSGRAEMKNYFCYQSAGECQQVFDKEWIPYAACISKKLFDNGISLGNVFWNTSADMNCLQYQESDPATKLVLEACDTEAIKEKVENHCKPASLCGNGQLDPGETCDGDLYLGGKKAHYDGCNAKCEIEGHLPEAEKSVVPAGNQEPPSQTFVSAATKNPASGGGCSLMTPASGSFEEIFCWILLLSVPALASRKR